MLKAVIFDMDGVIIDSEPMHCQAALLALQQFQIEVNKDYIYQFIGSTTFSMCQTIIHDFELSITPEELVYVIDRMKEQLLKSEGHSVVPYVIPLLQNLYEHGLRLAIASSSTSEAIEEVMDTLDIRKYFCCYVSGNMVEHTKPAPDIFNEAVRRLGVSSEECLVIEDSYHGVTAATAAGITCLGYVNPNSGNQNLSRTICLIEGFDEVNYKFLNQIYQYVYWEPAVILETEHFIIKELSEADMNALYEIYQKPDVKKYLSRLDNLSTEKEKHKAYIKSVYQYYGFGLWGVFLKDTHQLVGRCGIELKVINQNEEYEIGYLLDPAFQGKGYAKEFVSKIIEYGYHTLHITKLMAIIETNNIRSIRLAEAVGMIRKGEVIRDHRKCYLYEITP
jgi:HAD superfamily hydrolase (TIGR01509 family)